MQPVLLLQAGRRRSHQQDGALEIQGDRLDITGIDFAKDQQEQQDGDLA
jgi:hypothetical protein